MQIHYDGLIYMLQAAGGVNRYFANIIRRLPNDLFPVLSTYQVRDPNLPRHANLRSIDYRRFSPGILCSALRPWYFRAANAKNSYDVAHPTYYSLLTGRGLDRYRCPVVITVYDLILEKFKEQLDPGGVHCAAKKQAIMAAQAIICISESTKSDLLDAYGVAESKILVTHLATDIALQPADGAEPVPDRPYFLYVGGRGGYKNFGALAEALARVAARHPDVLLCVVGAPLDPVEKTFLAKLGLQRQVRCCGQVTDAHLAKLYRRCVAFVYPSLYEGFGIPLLEAMSCSAPVIACNSSSIPEVVGDAALLFDPGREEELTGMLFTLLEKSSERDRLILLGSRRAKTFSWEKTAASTVDLYRSIT